MDITARFKGAEVMPLLQHLPVCVVGNGGIGSHFLFTLTKAGPAMVYNYEYDEVEAHNLGGQMFSVNQIGQRKSFATEKNCSNFNNYEYWQNLGKFKEGGATLPIMFMCVDKNSVRKIALEAWVKNAEEHNWIHTIEVNDQKHDVPFVMIDGRLSFDQLNLFVITKDNVQHHLDNKLPLADSETTPDCTTKSNPFVGPVVANLMVSTYFNFLQNTIDYNSLGITARKVPYLMEYNFSTCEQKISERNETSIWNYKTEVSH